MAGGGAATTAAGPTSAPATRVITGRFALLVAATFAVFLAVGTIIVALPHYVEDHLGGGSSQIGLAVGAFSVAAVISRPFAGRLGDERGRRALLVAGPVVMAAGVGLFPLADSMWALFLLRAVQGAGEAAFYVGAASAVTDLAPPERRGEAVSYFSVALYLGLALGPGFGEKVLGDGHFTRVWLLAAGLALVGALLSTVIKDAPRAERAAGATRSKLFHPAALLPGAALGLGTISFAAFAAFLPVYTERIGLGQSGPVFLVFAGVTLVGRILGARVPDRFGASGVARAGLAGIALGMLIMGAWREPAGLYLGTLVFAGGNAFVFPAVLSMAVDASSDSERGAVVGTVTAAFDASQGVGAFTLGPLAGVVGYAGTFLAGGVAAALGVLILLTAAPAAAHRRRPADVLVEAAPPAA